MLWLILAICCSSPGPATPGSASARAAEQVGPIVEAASEARDLAIQAEGLCDAETRREPLNAEEQADLRRKVVALRKVLERLEQNLRQVEEAVRVNRGEPVAGPPRDPSPQETPEPTR